MPAHPPRSPTEAVDLTPPQQVVISSGLLTSGFNCLVQMPTGSGKTWLAKYAIDETLRSNLRAIYLAPTRALASELYEKWSAGSDPKITGVFTGDFGTPDCPYPLEFDAARVLIMTPERLDACVRQWRH